MTADVVTVCIADTDDEVDIVSAGKRTTGRKSLSRPSPPVADPSRKKRQRFSDGIVAERFECPSCFDEASVGICMSPGKCAHKMCGECFTRFVSGRLEQKELCICPLCPATSAGVVPGWLIHDICGAEAAAANNANEQIHLSKVDVGKMRFWPCPIADCSNRFVVDKCFKSQRQPDNERIVHCTGCFKDVCIRCNVEDHKGFTCKQFQAWRKKNAGGEKAYAKMLETKLVKPCPNCSAPILKNGGCGFMTCEVCKSPNGMCWETGKPRWGPGSCGGGHNCH
jgi:hypothetical protein